MNKREFGKTMLAGGAAVAGASFLAGCVAAVSDKALDETQGDPWRCEKCGYLTRSKEDLSDVRCPRCHMKRMVRISEEEMENYLSDRSET